jgi:hypothetical protein
LGSFCELLLRPSLTVSLGVDFRPGELALFSLILAQADAGAATVLVDELDARSGSGRSIRWFPPRSDTDASEPMIYSASTFSAYQTLISE